MAAQLASSWLAAAEHALDHGRVDLGDGLVAAHGHLPLGRLLLEDVRLHPMPAHQLAGTGDLEALLGAGMGLLLWHGSDQAGVTGVSACASASTSGPGSLSGSGL